MSDFTVRTFPVTGGANGAVAANVILIADSANPRSAKPSTAAARGFLGVTLYATDVKGYASVRLNGTVNVRVGASAITAGDSVVSDANSLATTQAIGVSAAGQSAKQVIGVAITSAAAGALVEVLLQPQIAYA